MSGVDKPTVQTYWSERYGRRLHRVRVGGTPRALIFNDEDLKELIELAKVALGDGVIC